MLGLALLVSTIYLSPTLAYWRSTHSTAYFPITSYDEDYYAALAATIASGKRLGDHPFLADPGPARGIGNETLMFLPRLAAAGLVKLLGLGKAFAAISIIVPLLLFLFIYHLVEEVSGSPWWALAGACGVLLLPYYLPPLSAVGRSLAHPFAGRSALAGSLPEGFRYGRRYNPALSAILFYAFLLLHWKAAKATRLSAQITCGIVGGALFYAYYFFAAGAFVISALWAASCAIAHRDRLRAAMTVLLAQGILAVPFLFLTWRSLGLYEAAFSQRMHSPWLPTTDILAAAIPVVTLRVLRGASLPASWLATLAAGPILAMNTQVVTGIRVEPWHFDTYLVVPLSVLSLCAVCAMLLRRTQWLGARTAAAAFVIVSLGAGCMTARGAVRSTGQFGPNPAAVDGLVRAIRAMTSETDVLLVGDQVTSPVWMVAATGRPVFVSFYVASFPTSMPGGYRRRGLCYYWLNGYNESEFMNGPASDSRSYVYAPEGFRYWFYPELLTSSVKRLHGDEFMGCSSDPQGCCPPELRADWLVESVRSPFDRGRLSQLYSVSPAASVGEFRISRLARIR